MKEKVFLLCYLGQNMPPNNFRVTTVVASDVNKILEDWGAGEYELRSAHEFMAKDEVGTMTRIINAVIVHMHEDTTVMSIS